MKAHTCIIIDDEELGRDLLENFIGRLPHLELRGKFGNPLEALASYRESPADIIFLDIQMPEMTGIELLKTLSIVPAVIFTTAYNTYALESYELSVIDYLLKPFGFTRFLQAVNKATEHIDLKYKAQNGTLSIPSSLNSGTSDFLLINADRKILRLYLKDITYIQSLKEYVVYYTDKEKIMALGSLKSLEEKLPSTEFIRIHKSYIVAKNRVKSVEGNQLDIGDATLPIGGIYRKEVMTSLF